MMSEAENIKDKKESSGEASAAEVRSPNVMKELNAANENVWYQIGSLSETFKEPNKAIVAYENCLRFNPRNVEASKRCAGIWSMWKPERAVEYFRRALTLHSQDPDLWIGVGHCYLKMNDYSQTFSSYSKALSLDPQSKNPALWYGIGLMYERYQSRQHAEEAYLLAIRANKAFEMAYDVYLRLAVIMKLDGKFEEAIEYLQLSLARKPNNDAKVEIWLQIGHVHELQDNVAEARSAYNAALQIDPYNSKVLQQLGWLCHVHDSDDEKSVEFLKRAIENDEDNGQLWYLLGRCYVSKKEFRQAHQAYQQAVHLDGKNPNYWCSIGVLFYQLDQHADAKNAYARAIYLNPNLSKAWYDLGTLHQSLGSYEEATAAYQTALELDPDNTAFQKRYQSFLEMLRNPDARAGERMVRDNAENIAADQIAQQPTTDRMPTAPPANNMNSMHQIAPAGQQPKQAPAPSPVRYYPGMPMPYAQQGVPQQPLSYPRAIQPNPYAVPAGPPPGGMMPYGVPSQMSTPMPPQMQRYQMPVSDQRMPMGGAPSMPMGGPPSMSMGGAPSMSMGGAPSMSMGGAPSMSMGGAPSMPMGGPPSMSMGGAPSMPMGGAPSMSMGGAPSMSMGGAPSMPMNMNMSGHIPMGSINSMQFALGAAGMPLSMAQQQHMYAGMPVPMPVSDTIHTMRVPHSSTSVTSTSLQRTFNAQTGSMAQVPSSGDALKWGSDGGNVAGEV